jgi:hypothetical protein
MSHKNNLNPTIRCPRTKEKNNDFCKYHKRYKKYMTNLKKEESTNNTIINNNINNINNDYLDKNFSESLFGYYDSWKEVPEKYRININRWWDIRILVEIIGNQLCTSDMNNPKPNFPFDPFTRINYTQKELDFIKNKIKELKLKIYIGLITFFNINYHKIYDPKKTHTTSSEMVYHIIDNFGKTMRYKLINNKNSQDCYTGLWVPKNMQLSTFEYIFKQYDNMLEQSIIRTRYDVLMIPNPEKKRLQNILDRLPTENVMLSDELLLAHL